MRPLEIHRHGPSPGPVEPQRTHRAVSDGRRDPAVGRSTVALATTLLAGLACGPEAPPPGAPDLEGTEPPLIRSVDFDWSTHRRAAPGSDNWPLTWAADGTQYTSWGDGGGFGGTNSLFRVSLGVARVEGPREEYEAVNVWGHPANAESPAEIGGKSYGILALRDSLFMWVSPGSGVENWTRARLHRSGDGGRSWQPTEVVLEGARDSMGVPAFLQQGPGHQWSEDGWVYVYASEVRQLDRWEVQIPGRIFLMRVREDSVSVPGAYRYFAGPTAAGEPRWSTDAVDRRPVFEDPRGVMRNSAIYVRPLDRYVLITNHTARNEGNIGMFEGPEPWGPWHTVLYESGWGEGHVAPNAFYWNIAPAWLGPDGRDFTLVFTGKEENDSWNSVRGRFELRQGAPPPAGPP